MASIYLWAANFAPRNWLYCEGQLLAISSNTALFSLLGTTFGGDGRTTFGLPDFRGRIPVGAGQGPGLSNVDLGQKAGAASVTLTLSNLPAHTHGLTNVRFSVGVSASPPSTEEADGAVLTNTADSFYATGGVSGSLGGVSLAGTTDITGANLPISLMPPYLGINFVICAQGYFPSRS